MDNKTPYSVQELSSILEQRAKGIKEAQNNEELKTKLSKVSIDLEDAAELEAAAQNIRSLSREQDLLYSQYRKVTDDLNTKMNTIYEELKSIDYIIKGSIGRKNIELTKFGIAPFKRSK